MQPQSKRKGEEKVETQIEFVENVGVAVTGTAETKDKVASRSVDLDSKSRG